VPTYKVVEVAQKKSFGRTMTAKDLEKVLNEEAGQEWTLDRILDADTADFLIGKRDVFLAIFRK